MKTVFRKEIKYVLPIESFFKMEELLDGLMNRDFHGMNGTYTVRSLYYDSIFDHDLRDNLSGVMEKRKIRLRVYSPYDKIINLEYKCKSGNDGKKYSIPLSRCEANEMLQQRYEILLNRREVLAQQLYVKLEQYAYRPKTIIEYDRTAFTFPVSDVRVTFDTNIRGSAGSYGFLEENPFLNPIGGGDTGVLEIKYNDFFPTELKEVIIRVDSLAEASSKYSKVRMAYI